MLKYIKKLGFDDENFFIKTLKELLSTKGVKQSSDELKCSCSFIRKAIKKFNLFDELKKYKSRIITKQCKLCGKDFYTTTNHLEKIFCNKNCRGTFFSRNNKEKIKGYNRKKYLKTKLYCKNCRKEIPEEIRKSGKTTCSDECSKKLNIECHTILRKEAQKNFDEYKSNLGCDVCGYNKCTACFDFHHKDPTKKEFRITATVWFCQTERVKKELEKCVLLCKNCHYEIHYNKIILP